VAENIKVCMFLGKEETIALILLMNPIYNITSASSNTKMLTLSKEKRGVSSMCYKSLKN
jgi:hypothetical protein